MVSCEHTVHWADDDRWLLTYWEVSSSQKNHFRTKTEIQIEASSGGEPRQEGWVGTNKILY